MAVNKSDLIEAVARKAHLTHKAAEEAIEAFLGEIQRAVGRGERVKVFGFGVFGTRRTAGREVMIPGTTQKVKVKAGRVPKFTPGEAFKRAVK